MRILALLLAFAGAAAAEGPPVVRIDSGPISGETLAGESAVRVWRGIPYAAPPVGGLRWRPPAPVTPWEEVRECVEFGPACPQLPGPARAGRAVGEMSEDCLTLNVWSAAGPDERRPVMVWIHGGGHVIGAGSLPFYDGRTLAARGVVLVTMNYRLGPFGYLAHAALAKETGDGSSGNYGMMDQIAALRWVKRNIAAFGGDPERVTIFGESAGAVSVSCLMASPAAKGLFHRAIAESGGPTGVDDRMRTEQGAALQNALGLEAAEDPLAGMRKAPWREVLDAAQPEAAGRDRARKFGPCVDGNLLPVHPAVAFETGRVHDVPFLAGSNADDGDIFARNFPVKNALGYRLVVRGAFKDHADEVMEIFPPGDDVPATVRRLLTVLSFVEPARRMARGAAREGEAPAFLYHFTRVCPGAERIGAGAAHGLEIPYVFGTANAALCFTEADDRLADAMQRYWIAFATTGDPNVEGLPEWPAYAEETDRHQELGDEVRPGAMLFERECDLFRRIRPGE